MERQAVANSESKKLELLIAFVRNRFVRDEVHLTHPAHSVPPLRQSTQSIGTSAVWASGDGPAAEAGVLASAFT